MEFLNSAFVGLLAFGSVPIIIHLLNRQRYKKIKWAAMEFLLAALKKTKRRLQLENIILLLIRILAVLFFVLSISKTRLTYAPASIVETKDTLYIIVFDDSFSMANSLEGKTPFKKAKEVVSKILKNVNTEKGDEIHIFLTSKKGDDLVKNVTDLTRLSKIIEQLEVSDYPADLLSTFEKAKQIIETSKKSNKKLIILTDLQKESWGMEEAKMKKFEQILEQLSSLSDVVLFDLSVKNIENCTITELTPNINLIGAGMKFEIIAKVKNFGVREFTNGKLNFYVDNRLTKIEDIPAIMPKGESEVKFQCQIATPGPHVVKAVLESDSLQVDNERYLALNVREFLNVLIFDGEFSPRLYEDEVRYLAIALSPDEKSSIFRIKTVTESEFFDTDLFEYDCVILANCASISQIKIAQLEEYVRKGGGVLIFGGDRIEASFYNEYLYKEGSGILPARIGETKTAADYQNLVNLTKVNFNHPSMKFFKRDRTLFNRIFVDKYHVVTIDKEQPNAMVEEGKVEIIACFSDNELSPAIIEKKLGNGKTIFFATSADSEWNFMQACEVYVPLMDQLVSYMCTRREDNFNIEVGEQFEQSLSIKDLGDNFSIKLPDNATQGMSPIKVGTNINEYYILIFKDTHKKGYYTIEKIKKSDNSRRDFSYFCVNLNVDESNIETYSKEEIEKMYPRFKFSFLEQLSEKEEEILKKPASNIWKYLLYALVGLVVIETILAQIFGSR